MSESQTHPNPPSRSGDASNGLYATCRVNIERASACLSLIDIAIMLAGDRMYSQGEDTDVVRQWLRSAMSVLHKEIDIGRTLTGDEMKDALKDG